jgi:hypothetical protein
MRDVQDIAEIDFETFQRGDVVSGGSVRGGYSNGVQDISLLSGNLAELPEIQYRVEKLVHGLHESFMEEIIQESDIWEVESFGLGEFRDAVHELHNRGFQREGIHVLSDYPYAFEIDGVQADVSPVVPDSHIVFIHERAVVNHQSKVGVVAYPEGIITIREE